MQTSIRLGYIMEPGISRPYTMTLDKARETLRTHITMGSGYNRNAARLVMAEVMREHGQQAVDNLIRELELDSKFDFMPGTHFKAPGT